MSISFYIYTDWESEDEKRWVETTWQRLKSRNPQDHTELRETSSKLRSLDEETQMGVFIGFGVRFLKDGFLVLSDDGDVDHAALFLSAFLEKNRPFSKVKIPYKDKTDKSNTDAAALVSSRGIELVGGKLGKK